MFWCTAVRMWDDIGRDVYCRNSDIPVHGISYSYDRNWQFILNKCKPLPKMPLTLFPGNPCLQKLEARKGWKP